MVALRCRAREVSSWLSVWLLLLWLLPACAAEALPSAKAPMAAERASDGMAQPQADQAMDPGASPAAAAARPSVAPGFAPSPGAGRFGGSPAPAGASPGQDPAGADSAAQAKELDPDEAKRPPAELAQMLVYLAELQIQVERTSFAENIDRVVDIAVSMGGYVSQHDNQRVQVRVPSARFREALRAIEKLGEVTSRKVQAKDVSEEYHDLAVRLKSLRATRDRLEQFLARAKNIAEVLQVEKELSRLNAEVDRIEGRMRFLASQAAFSTIIAIFQPQPEQQVVVEAEDQPPAAPTTIALPIDWLDGVGLDRLLDLN